jgi:putative transposase
VIKERCFKKPLVLHSDNGSPMRSQTLLEKLYELGITPSRSRPRVSNDNPFSESLFRTLKYCPQWPSGGFKSIVEARAWVNQFMNFYNNEHRHSQIRFVTPAQRHAGEDAELLRQREEVYVKAKARNPRRWSRNTRNWQPIGAVTLNPGRELDQMKRAA